MSKIVEIEGGDLVTHAGNYDFYEQRRAMMSTQQEAQLARQEAMLAKERAFIARFAARASHAAQVQSRVKKLDKIDKVEPPRLRVVVDFEFPEPPRSGDDVAGLTAVRKAYGDHVVHAGLDLTVRWRERWCVMGVNGSGKSTLIERIAGQGEPDGGDVRIGASATMGYFAQHSMEILDPEATVLGQLEAAFPCSSQARCSITHPISWCWTSRPTISTWTPRTRWSRPSRATKGR